MHLTLIKSSTNPDPRADRGHHAFTYALMPHAGDLTQVRTEARRLNNPLIVAEGRKAWAPLVSGRAENVIIETLKPAEDGNGFILRLYESDRRRGPATLSFGLPLRRVCSCDLLEQDQEDIPVVGGEVTVSLKPFEILTLRCIRPETELET